MDFHNRHFILYGAFKEGEEIGAALVSHAERVEHLEEDYDVQRVPLNDISPSPYFMKSFDWEENNQYLKQAHDYGVLREYPLVRPVEDGYEIIDGHKGLWVCEQAGSRRSQ